MAPKVRGKKRVRIQSGHEARYIEKRRTSQYRKSRPKRRPNVSQAMAKLQRTSRSGRIGRARTHKPTVAELVYQFLQRASNRGVSRDQKTNATNQFRKLHRRPKADRPERYRRRLSFDNASKSQPQASDDGRRGDRRSDEAIGNCSIEKCIYEMLSFGTVLGLLEPADRDGMVFRVSSDLKLFKDAREKHLRKKSFSDKYAPMS